MVLELSERRKISKLQGELVRLAESLVDNSNDIWLEKKGNKEHGLTESQLRNVSTIGSSTECVEVITNFIKYQMGRSKKGVQWNLLTAKSPKSNMIPADQRFGDAVIHVMNRLMEKQVKKVSDQHPDEVWIELCRSFWGYLIRYTKYLKEK